MAGRLLDQCADQLRLKLGHVQALLEGVLGQHHVVIDAGLIDRYGKEQLAALQSKR